VNQPIQNAFLFTRKIINCGIQRLVVRGKKIWPYLGYRNQAGVFIYEEFIYEEFIYDLRLRLWHMYVSGVSFKQTLENEHFRITSVQSFYITYFNLA
jgi:hypothetical protein